MSHKLNKVSHDPLTGTIFISLRPRTQRRVVESLEYPGRVILDLDDEGDIYGVRLLGVDSEDVGKILRRLGEEV